LHSRTLKHTYPYEQYAQKLCEGDRLKAAALVLLCSVSPRGSTGTVMRYLFQKPKLAWEIVRAFVFKEAATDLAICRQVFFSDAQPADETVRRYMGTNSQKVRLIVTFI
jgi:hypothetical protein